MNHDFQIFHVAQAQATIPQTAAPGGAGDQPPVSAMGAMGSWLPLILIFAIMYFIMIRPAQRKEKERKQEIMAITAGARVLFGGGIIGTIVEVKEATFKVEVAKGVTFEISKGSVQRKIDADATVSMDDARQ